MNFLEKLISLMIVMPPLIPIPFYIIFSHKLKTQKQKNQLANYTVFYVISILSVFVFIGTYILNIFGLTMNVINIAGGIILFRTGYYMMYPESEPLESDSNDNDIDDVEEYIKTSAFSPLAIPLLAGPAALSWALINSKTAKNYIDKMYLIACIVLVGFMHYMTFIGSSYIEKIFGETGLVILQKITGFLLTLVGVQFVVNGIKM